MEQLPNNQAGMEPQNSMTPGNQPEHMGSRGVLIAVLIIVIVAFLGYWYFTKDTSMDMQNVQTEQRQAAPNTDSGSASDISAIEDDLDSLYFEGTAEGL